MYTRTLGHKRNCETCRTLFSLPRANLSMTGLNRLHVYDAADELVMKIDGSRDWWKDSIILGVFGGWYRRRVGGFRRHDGLSFLEWWSASDSIQWNSRYFVVLGFNVECDLMKEIVPRDLNFIGNYSKRQIHLQGVLILLIPVGGYLNIYSMHKSDRQWTFGSITRFGKRIWPNLQASMAYFVPNRENKQQSDLRDEVCEV